MAEFEIQADFEIPGDDLWAIIRNFGDVSWLPGAPAPEFEGDGVGMIRSVRVPPLPIAREQLDAIDDERRAVYYHVIDGNPLPVREYSASMQVVDAGAGRSRLLWSSRWEPDGVSEEAARKVVARFYRGILKASKPKLERR